VSTSSSNGSPNALALKAASAVDTLCRGLLVLTVASLLLALVALTLNVVFRFFLTSMSGWIVELVQGDSVYQFARAAIVIMIFGGLPEVTRRRAHIRIGVVPDRASASWARRLDLFNLAASALIFTGFTWACAVYALNAYRLNTTIGSNPPWPVWPIAAFMVVGLAFSVLVLVAQVLVPSAYAGDADRKTDRHGEPEVAKGDEAL
jgi:TRAP-type C4-dicarboxylate transport system permease small subunit